MISLQGKGLKRLAFFVVFLIPVTWYLFLQLFGSNNFSLSIVSEIPEECNPYQEVTILSKRDSLSVVETNYMNRVIYSADKRKLNLVYESSEFFKCLNQSDSDLVLIDGEGIWGAYELTRDDVDRLLTELDILSLQKTYGKETTR